MPWLVIEDTEGNEMACDLTKSRQYSKVVG